MELRTGTPREAGMLPERIDRARDLCAGWVKSGHTPAINVIVARRGVICLHEAFGKLRPDADSSSAWVAQMTNSTGWDMAPAEAASSTAAGRRLRMIPAISRSAADARMLMATGGAEVNVRGRCDCEHPGGAARDTHRPRAVAAPKVRRSRSKP